MSTGVILAIAASTVVGWVNYKIGKIVGRYEAYNPRTRPPIWDRWWFPW